VTDSDRRRTYYCVADRKHWQKGYHGYSGGRGGPWKGVSLGRELGGQVAADEAFKVYMTRKTQGWFQRLRCPRPSDATTSSGSGAAPGGAGSGAGAATPARPQAPEASDDEGASDLITGGAGDDQPTSPNVNLEALPDGVLA
jgi:hypothetical protein